MDASLDTNVIIHLYYANCQDILFRRFDKIYIYDFIYSKELHNHASQSVLNAVNKDIQRGRIELIDEYRLKEIGMLQIFRGHVREFQLLFDGSDLGEVYAISLALTLGCASLVTDDIKVRGPHYSLMNMDDCEVIPFAFYELLFLDYIEYRITEEKLVSTFLLINEMSNLNMVCLSKLKLFMKRFWTDPHRAYEKDWIDHFCKIRSISGKERMSRLCCYLKENLI